MEWLVLVWKRKVESGAWSPVSREAHAVLTKAANSRPCFTSTANGGLGARARGVDREDVPCAA